jgi:hypothetical protein
LNALDIGLKRHKIIRMKILSLIVLTALAAPPEPAAEPKVVWSAACVIKDKRIQIEVMDDKKINFQSDSTEVEAPLSNTQHGDVTAVSPTNKKFGVCTDTAGILIDKTKLLVLIGSNSDNEQKLEHLNAFLVDTENLKILDTKEMLGDYADSGKNKIFLKKINNGLSALIAQGWKKSANKKSQDSLFMGWLNITVVENKITSRWEMDLPPTHKPYNN